jgi:excisionase family DNA binding protein
MDNTPLFHTIPQACKRLALGRTKVYALIQQRRLRPVKVGRRTLIPEADIQRFAAELIEEAREMGTPPQARETHA